MATASYWNTSHACLCGAAMRYNGATGRYYCRACGRKLTRDGLGRDGMGRMHDFLKGLDAHIERADDQDEPPTCETCGALLSEVEAAGRASGKCNECLRDKEAYPRVGDGATLCLWTDRHAATVVYVSASFKTIRIQEDVAKLTSGSIFSEAQEYTYTPNPEARIITATRRHDGKFRVANGTERVIIGDRREYRDPSF